MKPLTQTAILLLFSVFLSCHSGKRIEQNRKEEIKPSPYAFHFVESQLLSPVLDQAGLEGKLVFIDLYATWCAPCRLMEEQVFTDKELAAYFNEHFISYRVNVEQGNGTNLATIFEVKVLPTLLFLDEKGNILVRKEGAAMQTEMRYLAAEALSKKQ